MSIDMSDQQAVTTICDRLGRRRMADRIGVRPTSISNAVVDGRFPAKWFIAVREMCREEGLECPERLFNFVPPSDADDTHTPVGGSAPPPAITSDEDAA